MNHLNYNKEKAIEQLKNYFLSCGLMNDCGAGLSGKESDDNCFGSDVCELSSLDILCFEVKGVRFCIFVIPIPILNIKFRHPRRFVPVKNVFELIFTVY